VTIEAIRSIIVDDEALARDRMRALLAPHPDIIVVRECVGGRDAVDTLTSTPVDLVFLDVQMPELDGFGVVAEVGAERMPPVIFTSAYSEFAVRAFEAYALDYLLKPFDATRLAAALDRAREEVNARRAAAELSVFSSIWNTRAPIVFPMRSQLEPGRNTTSSAWQTSTGSRPTETTPNCMSRGGRA
jgi:two-component system, LytTR family, response regulator